MINCKEYEIAKAMFIGGKSLRQIEKETNINRKELSKKLKEDNIYEGKDYTQKQILASEILLENGFTLTDICKLFKISRNNFSSVLEKENIRVPIHHNKKHDYNSDMCNKIYEDYINGIKIKDIVEKYNISDPLIYKILKYHNYDLNNSNRKRKYHFNENYFEQIDTEEKAYWLGFLYADGYVYHNISYSVELTLKYEDKRHVRKFAESVGYDGNIQDKEVTLNNKIFKASRVTLCSKKMTEDLIDKGCMQHKSLILKFPNENKLQKDLVRHFIRGYFDGDGSIVYSCNSLRMSILGTYDFLYTLSKHISLNTGYDMKIPQKSKSKAYDIKYGGNKQCKAIYNYLYDNANIYLHRKKNVFENCRSRISI